MSDTDQNEQQPPQQPPLPQPQPNEAPRLSQVRDERVLELLEKSERHSGDLRYGHKAGPEESGE